MRTRRSIRMLAMGLCVLASHFSSLAAPCNLPPMPSAGGTVTWTFADSPYEVCTDLLLLDGSSVVIEPGVEVLFDPDRTLKVSGTMTGVGTVANRIRFEAPAVFPPAVWVEGGTLDLQFVDFRGQLRPGSNGTILLSDCTFADHGVIFGDGAHPWDPALVRLERCAFTGTEMTISDSWVVLKDVTMNGGFTRLLRDYLVTEAVTLNGTPLSVLRQESIQPQYVNGITATGVTAAGGLNLEGGNFLLGPDNVLLGNLYPIDIRGGLLPGSVVPLAGNTSNRIWAHEGAGLGLMRWPNLGLPYFVDGLVNGGGNLTIEPGVRVEFGEHAGLAIVSTRRLVADGLPDAPITFTAAGQAQPWQGLIFQANGTEGPRLEHCRIEDADFGVIVDDSAVEVHGCSFGNNGVAIASATFGDAIVRKSRFVANGVAVQTSAEPVSGGTADLFGGILPNAFEGNGVGVFASASNASFPAQENWWGSPTGPRHPANPDGLGDSVEGAGASGVGVLPFRTAPPDFENTPPVVRILEPSFDWRSVAIEPGFVLEPGSRIVLRWEAQDDDTLVEQRILLSPQGSFPASFGVVASGLPPTQRSFEWLVPDVGFAVTNQPQFLRIVALDAAGQEGWDQTPILVPSGRVGTDLEITSDFGGQTFTAGQDLPAMAWQGDPGLHSVEAFVVLESDGALLDGVEQPGEAELGTAPWVSTDAARLALRVHDNSNDVQWIFSDSTFSIRMDPRLGLSVPSVNLLTPTAGSSFDGGGVVPFTWEASDAEGLRTFDIQASYDGGRTWHLVVRDLPADARSYDWQLPGSAGIPDVRARVIARNLRFANSSDGSGSFAIATAGCASVPPSGSPLLTVEESGPDALLSWTSLAGATGYDVVGGSLDLLRSSGGDFSVATQVCVADGQVATSTLVSGAPAPGAGLWWLVRGENCGGRASYGTGSPFEQGYRDGGILLSPAACP